MFANNNVKIELILSNKILNITLGVFFFFFCFNSTGPTFFIFFTIIAFNFVTTLTYYILNFKFLTVNDISNIVVVCTSKMCRKVFYFIVFLSVLKKRLFVSQKYNTHRIALYNAYIIKPQGNCDYQLHERYTMGYLFDVAVAKSRKSSGRIIGPNNVRQKKFAGDIEKIHTAIADAIEWTEYFIDITSNRSRKSPKLPKPTVFNRIFI